MYQKQTFSSGLKGNQEGSLKGSADASYSLSAQSLAAPYAAVYGLSPTNGQGPAGKKPTFDTTPLRVIHVSQFLMRAGIEHWLQALLRYADPSKIRLVRTVVTTDVYDPQMVQELGFPVEVGGSASVQSAAADCDVLLASSPSYLAELLGDARPPLCVFVAHGDNVASRSLLEQNAGVIDHVIAVSERVKEAVCEGFPTTVIHNGADLTHLARSRSREMARNSLGFAADDFVLGYVGRFSEEKRPQALIEAAAQLPRQFKVLLVGWGHMRSELLEMANMLIPGRFAIADARGNLGDYYQAMDAFGLLSCSEGFGLVILEAMLCGVPVIATPVGCAPEIIVDRVNGLLVSEDPASVAEAATRLQSHPAWAEGLATEAMIYAEQHGTAEVMCRRYEDLLHQLHAAKLHPVARAVPTQIQSYA